MLVWAGGEGGKDSEGSEHRGVGANVSRGAYGPLLHGQELKQHLHPMNDGRCKVRYRERCDRVRTA